MVPLGVKTSVIIGANAMPKGIVSLEETDYFRQICKSKHLDILTKRYFHFIVVSKLDSLHTQSSTITLMRMHQVLLILINFALVSVLDFNQKIALKLLLVVFSFKCILKRKIDPT